MSGQTVTQAVATQEKRGVIEQYRGDFAAVLPSHVKADQWVRLTQGLFRRDGKLQRILDINPGSVLSALLDCARLGLEVGDTYHLVPFGNEIVGITDYTGLIELIYRAGAVKSVKAEVVYERDLEPDPHDVDPATGLPRPRFKWEPSTMDVPHHRPDWFSNRGAMVGAYAYAVMLDGSPSQVVIRNRAEIEKVKAVSKTAHKPDSPWVKWEDRMWLKTVLRELSKFVPTSAEYRRVTQAITTGETRPTPSYDMPPTLHLDDGDIVDGEVVTDSGSAQPVTGTAKPA